MNEYSILVVDDESYNFDIIQGLLNTTNVKAASFPTSNTQPSPNYQCHYAASGLEALAFLDTFHPDLILLDVMMPEMDGIELCQRIKSLKQWEMVPIIMVTALKSKENLVQCLSAGADDFISKPVSRLELCARVRSMLRIRELYIQLEDLIQFRTSQLSSALDNCEHLVEERLLTERALSHTEGQFQALIENASDMVMLLDTEHVVHYVTPSVQQNLGYLPSDLNKKQLTRWIHPNDHRKFSKLLIRSLENPGKPQKINILWQHQEENWRVFETISQYFQDTKGFSGIVINARDITDRLQAEAMEQALKQEKQMSDLKLNFFSMASHEFRTPLSVILMAAQILENAETESQSPKRYKNLQRIQSSATHLTRLLSNTLEVARLEAQPIVSKPQPVCLRTWCQQILDPLQSHEAGEPRIHYTYNGPGTEVRLDPKLLDTIMTNLLSNALKYSQRHQSVQFKVTQELEQVDFKIIDSGIGIPSADQLHLFDTFYRGDNVGRIEGSGLGLAIVKKCVDLHHGKINVDSVENQGTTFSVQIPHYQ